MARRCAPNRTNCGMSQGLYNPFFQNGAPWYGSGGGGQDTDSQDRQAFLVVGDSIYAGLTGHTASTLPSAGTAYEFDRNTDTIQNFGSGAGVSGFSFNSKSPWAKFCIDYNAGTGYKPVIINRAASASTISPALSGLVGNDWQTTGTNYDAAVTAANTCLSQMGINKLKAIFIDLGINDAQGQSGTGSFSVSEISTYLSTLIDNLQAEFGTDVPIIYCQIGRYVSTTVSARIAGIRAAIRSKCVNYTNVHFGAQLLSFQVAGLYSDSIHPGRDGNDALGAMNARWFTNSDISNKWARSIIACQHEAIASGYKTKINNFITTYQTEYLTGCDYFFPVKQAASKASSAFDWSFLAGPGSDGSFTFSAGTGASTNGSNQTFECGYNDSECAQFVTQNDYLHELKFGTVAQAGSTTACAMGLSQPTPTRVLMLRQLNTGGVNFALTSGTSFTYATDTNFADNASYMQVRNNTALALWKNGVSVSPQTDTSAAFATLLHRVGCLNNNTSNAQFCQLTFERVSAWKQSLISDKAAFVTALDTLQS